MVSVASATAGYPRPVHPLCRVALLLVSPTLACTATSRGGTTPPASSTTRTTTTPPVPATTTASVDFSRIFLADLSEERWQTEHGVSLPQTLREQLGDGFDGVERKFPAAAHGITSPFAEGDAVALVTGGGTIESRVTGLGAGIGGGNDWLIAVLERTAPEGPAGGALAVFGPHPHRDARLVAPPSVPHGPLVLPAIEAARGELPALTAELATELASEYGLDEEDGEDDEEARDEIAATIARIGVGPECATTFAPRLPPGFDQLLLVDCSDYGEGIPEGAAVIPVPDPAVSALVVLGEHPQVLEGWSLHRWGTTLRAVVDLDGDGIDELWVDTNGHEWNASTLWHWDGKGYVAEEITSDAL